MSSRSGQWVLASGGYFSSDYGASFAVIADLPHGAYSVALSSDASTVYVVDNSTEYTVRKGTGTPGEWSWSTLSVPAATASRVISASADGQYAFIASASGELYYSVNSGVTWTLSASLLAKNYELFRLATSLNGKVTYVIAYYKATGGTFPLISQDYGATWNFTGFPAGLYVNGLATNEDGSVLTIGQSNGHGLIVSNDYGTTWSWSEIEY